MSSVSEVPKTIIFTPTKNEACNVYSHLNSASCMKGTVGMYHANLTTHNKALVHDQFKRGIMRILVATVAYGMVCRLILTHNKIDIITFTCMDILNIQLVVVYGPSSTLTQLDQVWLHNYF